MWEFKYKTQQVTPPKFTTGDLSQQQWQALSPFQTFVLQKFQLGEMRYKTRHHGWYVIADKGAL